MPEPTPEAWAQIRHDYENTDRPIVDICFEHEITAPMLRYRVKVWNWQRRKPFVPRQGPPAVAVQAIEALHPPLEGEGRRFERERKPTGWGEADRFASHPTPPAFADAAVGDPPPPGEGEDAIVPRLQGAVARVLPAIEATIARLASGAHPPREMEQAGRTLSSLTRTLRELNALLAEHRAEADDGDAPEDIDEFRRDLARRLQGLVDAEKAREAEREQGHAERWTAAPGHDKQGEP